MTGSLLHIYLSQRQVFKDHMYLVYISIDSLIVKREENEYFMIQICVNLFIQ